jgi:glycosyltransferase involved in cell wall biosynthesis
MITVLHLITGLQAHGAEMMLYKLVAHSDRARFRHVVVSMTGEGALGEQIKALDIPLYSLGMRRGLANPIAAVRFLILLRRVAPDVVQTWLYHADLLGLCGALALRIPVVWNIQASYHLGLKSLPSKLCARLSSLPATVIVNSEEGRAIHARFGYHPKRWAVLPNGFDTRQFVPDKQAREAVRRELNLPDGAVLIGMMARFDPQKDHRTFFHAARVISQQNPMAYFLLAGREMTLENAVIRQLVDEGKLHARTFLLGERFDMPRLTAALDIASLSSTFGEGFPGVVCEAMACEVPCVVTNIGASGSMVGDTGRVVPPRNPQALAAAWQELLRLPTGERAALGRRARERVKVLYSLEKIVQQYEEIYEGLAGRVPAFPIEHD